MWNECSADPSMIEQKTRDTAAGMATPMPTVDALRPVVGDRIATLMALLHGQSIPYVDEARLRELLSLASLHGLLPAVASRLPASWLAAAPSFAATIREALTRNTCRNLALLGETMRVVTHLRDRGITVVPFKGGVLAELAHGSVSQRQAGDIDLFVQKRELPEAIRLLRECGYQLDPTWSDAVREGHFRFDCECEMVNSQRQTCVDLHWEFTARNFSLPLPVEVLFSRLQPIRIQGSEILSFAPEDLLLILCLHAEKHHWHRLEWIFTIHSFIRRHPGLEWECLLERAAKMRLSNILASALVLVRRLFGGPLPARWREFECRQARAAKLAARALEWIRTGELKPTPFEIRRFHAASRPGWLGGLRYWLGAIFTPTEKDYRVRLPAGLTWWYYVTRSFRLLSSSVTGMFGRRHAEAGETGALPPFARAQKQGDIA